MRRLLVLLVGCATSNPAPQPPTPALSEQELCERVGERVVDRFVTAAAAQWREQHPDLAPLSTTLEGEHHTMLVTVMFDSCLVEWPAPVRACFLNGSVAASIDSCALDEGLKAGALRRASTMLYSLSDR